MWGTMGDGHVYVWVGRDQVHHRHLETLSQRPDTNILTLRAHVIRGTRRRRRMGEEEPASAPCDQRAGSAYTQYARAGVVGGGCSGGPLAAFQAFFRGKNRVQCLVIDQNTTVLSGSM